MTEPKNRDKWMKEHGKSVLDFGAGHLHETQILRSIGVRVTPFEPYRVNEAEEIDKAESLRVVDEFLADVDLNAHPDEEPVMHVAAVMDNTRNICEQPPYGGIDTWNGFQFLKKPAGCIDYIFISKGNDWRVKKFATLTDSYDMKYPSDHFPVLAVLIMKKIGRNSTN